MNKKEINRLLPRAYQVLKDTKIVEKQTVIKKTYRGYISTFGAAVSGGSLLAAIAFFSEKKEEAGCDRTKLMQALCLLLTRPKTDPKKIAEEKDAFFQDIKRNITDGEGINVDKEAQWKEKVINGAIALKLAMNLYTLKSEEKQ